MAVDIVFLLLKPKCNPNSMNLYGETAGYYIRVEVGPRLINIAYQNMVDLLDAAADPNHILNHYQTLLEIWSNDIRFLSLQLESGCNPNTLGCDGYTKAIDNVLQVGTDPNVFTSYEMGDKIYKSVSLLHRAFLHQLKNIAWILSQSSGKICTPNVTNPAGYKVLCKAAVDGDIADVEIFVIYDADLHIVTSRFSWTPLNIATHMDNKSLEEFICNHNDDLNKQDATGSTGLNRAVRDLHRELQDLLYKA